METYIVRLWGHHPPADIPAVPPVRGVVRRVRSGNETRFESWDELRRILSEPRAEPGIDQPPPVADR